METCAVSGTLKTLTGAVVKDEPVLITLESGFFTTDSSFLRSLIRTDTDENGLLSVALVPGGTYRVEVRGEVWGFTLPEGSGPLSWQEARALGQPLTPGLEPTIAAYVDSRLEDVGGSVPLDPYGDYPGGVNATIRALIDRKAEKAEVGDTGRNLTLWLENQLAG